VDEAVEAVDLLQQEVLEMVETEQVLHLYLDHHHNLFMDQLLEYTEAEQEVEEVDLQEQLVELAEQVEAELVIIMVKQQIQQNQV
jgi:hypothetical protein